MAKKKFRWKICMLLRCLFQLIKARIVLESTYQPFERRRFDRSKSGNPFRIGGQKYGEIFVLILQAKQFSV